MLSPKTSSLVALLVVLASSPLMSRPAPGQDYDAYGYVNVYTWEGSEARNSPPGPHTAIADSAQHLGNYDDVGEAAYSGSLVSGNLQTYAYGINHYRPPAGSCLDAGGQGEVTIEDTLIFTIEPGSYPDGVYASVSVHVEGALAVQGNQSAPQTHVHATAHWNFTFPGWGTWSGTVIVDNMDEDLCRLIHEDATVEARLLVEGSVLTEPLIVERTFRGRLSSSMQASVSVNAGEATSDLMAQILSVDVPAGVSWWESASGVFLTDPAPVALAWRSVRDHGPAGNLAIELDRFATGSDVVSETRRDGVQRVEVDFSRDVTLNLYPVLAMTDGSTIAASNQYTINGGMTLVIEFDPGLPDEACYEIHLGVSIADLTGDTDCRVKILAGNTNGDDNTNLIDMAQTKSKNGSDPTVPGNARFDVNVDGNINLIDMALVKSLNGNSASCP